MDIGVVAGERRQRNSIGGIDRIAAASPFNPPSLEGRRRVEEVGAPRKGANKRK